MSKTNTQEILQSSAFKKLVKNRWNISLSFTFIMLFVYIGFLLLVAYDKELTYFKGVLNPSARECGSCC